MGGRAAAAAGGRNLAKEQVVRRAVAASLCSVRPSRGKAAPWAGGLFTTRGGAVRAPATQMNFSTPAAGKAEELAPFVYEDSWIKDILSNVRVIAMVGASPSWNRPSFFAMKYLQAKGFKVVPINPKTAGTEILGEHCYGSLKEMAAAGIEVDMVDVFRGGAVVVPIAQDAIDIGAKVLWMQLSVRNAEAQALAEAAGLAVVQDRCPKIEFSRLYGELGWHGFNSGVISSKRRKLVSADEAGKKEGGKEDGGEKEVKEVVELPAANFNGCVLCRTLDYRAVSVRHFLM